MNRLKTKIIKSFLIHIVVLYFINGVIDGVFEIYLRKYPDYSLEFNIIGFFNVLIGLILIALITLHFQRSISKYFEEEMKNQMDKNNLLYSSIAHDLKTPMTSIKGYAAALNDGKVEEKDLKKTYNLIRKKSDQMNSLLNDVFDFSKLSVDSYSSKKISTDLSNLVREAIISNYDLIEDRGIFLETDIEDSIFLVVIPNDFKRLVDNLLLNAIKHNDKEIKIGVGLKKREDEVVLYVGDSGELISDQDKDLIFNPFSKIDKARPTGSGSGLGLAIVDKIVEKHKGTIEIVDGYEGYTKAFVVKLKK